MSQRFSLRLISTIYLVLCTTSGLTGCARMSGFVMNESGQRYYKQGNYSMAMREFQKAAMDDPGNPHYAYNLAAAAHKNGRIEQAEQIYRHALEIDPSHQPSYHGLANLMMDQGRGEEAEQLVAAWAGTQPYLAEPHVELAWMQQNLGDHGAAEQSLRQALQVNPRHERAIAHLGQVYEKTGRPQEAMTMYQRSLYVNGYQPEVRSRMLALQEQYPVENQMDAPMETRLAGFSSPVMPTSTAMSWPVAQPSATMAGMYPMAPQPQVAQPHFMAHGNGTSSVMIPSESQVVPPAGPSQIQQVGYESFSGFTIPPAPAAPHATAGLPTVQAF